MNGSVFVALAAIGVVGLIMLNGQRHAAQECPPQPKITTDYDATDGSVRRCITVPGAPGINGGGGAGGAAVMCYKSRAGGGFGVDH